MTMKRTEIRRQLEPGLNAIFGMAYKNYAPQWTALFSKNKSYKHAETDVLMMGFGAAPDKAEGAGIEYDDGGEVWASRYVNVTVALGFALTAEAIDDNLYGDLAAKMTPSLKQAMLHSKELKAAAIFNNAFDSSYTGGDGKELCATDHPLAGGGTFSNELATPADLSETALEDMITLVNNFVDERGIPKAVTVRKLVVSGLGTNPFEAQRILGSQFRTGTNYNDVNAIYEMKMIPEGYVTNQRLTDTDAFYLLTDCPDGLKYFERTPMKTKFEEQFDTGNFRYKATERYTFGWTDPRALVGTAGA